MYIHSGRNMVLALLVVVALTGNLHSGFLTAVL